MDAGLKSLFALTDGIINNGLPKVWSIPQPDIALLLMVPLLKSEDNPKFCNLPGTEFRPGVLDDQRSEKMNCGTDIQ